MTPPTDQPTDNVIHDCLSFYPFTTNITGKNLPLVLLLTNFWPSLSSSHPRRGRVTRNHRISVFFQEGGVGRCYHWKSFKFDGTWGTGVEQCRFSIHVFDFKHQVQILSPSLAPPPTPSSTPNSNFGLPEIFLSQDHTSPVRPLLLTVERWDVLGSFGPFTSEKPILVGPKRSRRNGAFSGSAYSVLWRHEESTSKIDDYRNNKSRYLLHRPTPLKKTYSSVGRKSQ